MQFSSLNLVRVLLDYNNGVWQSTLWCIGAPSGRGGRAGKGKLKADRRGRSAIVCMIDMIDGIATSTRPQISADSMCEPLVCFSSVGLLYNLFLIVLQTKLCNV